MLSPQWWGINRSVSHLLIDASDLPVDARIQQPRGPRGARRWQQDGLVHHDAGQDRVSLGAPGPDLRGDRVRRLSRAKTAPLRASEQ